MNWDHVDSTVRQSYRKNGRDYDVHRGRSPLSDLIAKDPVPDFDEMTEVQLCEFAAEHHIAIEQDLERFEMIEVIKNALEQNWDERIKAIRGMLDYIFADGHHPLAVVRRIYGLTKALRPQCIKDMSLADLAVLCDDGKGLTTDGRATQSARIKRLIEEPIRRAGMHGFKAPFQKTDTACGEYSESAKGNQNRLGRGYLEINKGKA